MSRRALPLAVVLAATLLAGTTGGEDFAVPEPPAERPRGFARPELHRGGRGGSDGRFKKTIRAACWRWTNARHRGFWNAHPELGS